MDPRYMARHLRWVVTVAIIATASIAVFSDRPA